MFFSDGALRSRRGETRKPGTSTPSAFGTPRVFGEAVPGVCAVATLKHDRNKSQPKIRTFEKIT
jgi:hypothetical protein